MLNTFANHGYINRDGLGISIQDLQFAFETAINLDPAAAQVFGARALLVSTTGDSTTFNLDDLKAQGGTLQHDGSLSRADLYFGDVLSFNESVWAPTAARFNEKTIDLATAEAARKARLAEAKATNPEFNMTDADLRSSATETALYMAVFAEPDVPNEARAEWVKVLFGKCEMERSLVVRTDERYRARASTSGRRMDEKPDHLEGCSNSRDCRTDPGCLRHKGICNFGLYNKMNG